MTRVSSESSEKLISLPDPTCVEVKYGNQKYQSIFAILGVADDGRENISGDPLSNIRVLGVMRSSKKSYLGVMTLDPCALNPINAV